MEDTQRVRLFRKKVIRPYRGRGEVYSWLRAHHARVAELVPTWAWTDLVHEMLRDELKGQNGVTPTPKAVTKVWQRVQRDVEAEAKATKAKPVGGRYPSRIPADWRPQIVAPPPPIRAPLPTPPVGMALAVSAKPPADPKESREGLEEIDRAMEALRAEDRSKFRFGG